MSDTLPALVFDFDGTLIESAPALAGCLNTLLETYDRPTVPVADVEKMIGNGVAKLVERGFRATGGLPPDLDAAVERFIAIYRDTPADASPLYDGVMETLSGLHDGGYRMAICTNKLHGATVKILEGMDMAHFFPVVAGGDSFPVRKPDPGHLLAVLEQLGVAPADAIMIGDSPNDIGCAIAAGVRSIAVTYGYSRIPHAELGADRLIDRFTELPAALAQMDGAPSAS